MTIGRVANLTEPLGDRGACHYCGVCQRGCSTGAYFSSHSSTLPAARKTGNLELRANSVVEGLDYDPAGKRIAGVRVDRYRDRRAHALHREAGVSVRFDDRQSAGAAQLALGQLPERTGQSQRHARPLRDGSPERGIRVSASPRSSPASTTTVTARTGSTSRAFAISTRARPEGDFLRGYGFQGMALATGGHA